MVSPVRVSGAQIGITLEARASVNAMTTPMIADTLERADAGVRARGTFSNGPAHAYNPSCSAGAVAPTRWTLGRERDEKGWKHEQKRI